MKILYIDKGGVTADGYLYKYYGDLYRELNKVADVTLLQNHINCIHDFISENFDCVIFGLGYFARGGLESFQKIERLDSIPIPSVCLLHKPQTMLREKLEFCKINNIDLLVDSQCTYREFGKIANSDSLRIWFSATPEVYYPRNVPKIYDIGFSGATHGNGKIKGETMNLRERIYDSLNTDKYKVFWNAQTNPNHRISSTEEYAKKINESKIWLATTGPTLDVSPRYFEVILSKTLLFCNNMPEQYGGVFRDGFNCVMYQNDLSDFSEKLDFYVNNNKEREEIVHRGYEHIIENYTTKHMATRLINKIKEIKNEKL